MPTLLKAATLIEFEPVCIETGDLRIANGRIVARAKSLQAEPGEEVIDLGGRLVLPGLVSAHHRLHATALRGLKRQGSYQAQLGLLEALEAKLALDDVEALATVSGLEGLLSGTTTVFNVHSAPQPLGSLNRIAHGLHGVGLRAVLSCEVSQAAGNTARDEALEESTSYADRARGRFRAAFAFGRLSTVSDETLAALGAARAKFPTPPLVLGSLGEDPHEEAQSVERSGKEPVERLLAAGLVSPTSVLSHNVHLSWPQLSELISRGPWMVHLARANMASASGLATPSKFGVRLCLGTDVMALDVLAEAQSATLRSIEVGQPLNVLRVLANGHRLASDAFGATIGPLREGALADLLVSDYHPPTPLDESTLADHLLYGMSSRDVESVMVDGLWRLWKRKPLAIDVKEVGRIAREHVGGVWQRLGLPAS